VVKITTCGVDRLGDAHIKTEFEGSFPTLDAPRSNGSPAARHESRRLAKRLLDLVVGSVAFVVSLPILFAAVVATRSSGDFGPILYRAVRMGEGGSPFTMLKLRTMTSFAEGPGLTRARDPRVTTMGRILRRLKMDELPQLWNVVRGDMSLVGPRPEDARYIDWDDPLHRKVFTAKPGITGLAQIALPFEERLLEGPDPEGTYREQILPYKLRMDSFYLDHQSLSVDFRILACTVRSIFRPVGESMAAQASSLDGCQALIAEAAAIAGVEAALEDRAT